MDGNAQEALDARAVIGTNAGKVWEYLNSNDEATSGQIGKAIGESPSHVNQAIGWLSCEGKVALLKTGKSTKYRLADDES